MKMKPGFLAAAASIAIVALPLRASDACDETSATGVVRIIIGTAELRRGEAKEWQRARAGDSLSTGDWLRTAESSRATIRFCRGTINLGPNSEFRVTAPTDRSGAAGEITISKGRAWTQPAKDDKGLQLKSSTALDAVRK